MNQFWKRCGVLLLFLLHVGLQMPAQNASSPPYQCGFVLESEAAIRKVYAPELEALKLRKGEVIADVGGSNGYRMAMFAVLYDSLTFYIEDIDTLCLNAEEFDKVHAYYSKVKGSPLNCEFHLVTGTENATMLPNGIFDKVLVTASYHHFSDPAGMLAEIVTKLKPDGRIYLIENVVRKAGKRRRRLCNDPLKTVEGLRNEFEVQGFQVVAIHSLGRWWTKMFVLGKPANR